MASVSVVIPSAGGLDLIRALASVNEQTHPVDETIVILNNMAPSAAQGLARKPELSGCIVEYERTPGACAARDRGVELASSDYVAFLDADDLWRPEKIRRTMQLTAGDADVVSSRVRYFNDNSGTPVATAPVSTFSPGADLGSWLFVNRRLSVRRNVLHTSSLVVRAELAKSLRWFMGAPHEDWSFLLQAERAVGTAGFRQLPDVLVDVSMGTGRSLSAGIDCKSSLDWLIQHGEFLGDRAYADFLAGQVLRYALSGSSSRRTFEVFSEMSGNWRLVSARALALGASGLLGRQVFERLAAWKKI